MEKKNADLLKKVILKDSTIASYSLGNEDSIQQAIEDFWMGTKTNEMLNEGLLGIAKIEKNIEDIEPTIRTNNDKKGNKIVMIYAIPNTIKTSDGKEYFIGKYPTDAKKYDKRVDSMPIDMYFARKRIIPKEFLVGALTSNWGHESEIIKNVLVDYKPETLSPNSRYYGNMKEEDRLSFADKLISEMKEMKLDIKTVDEVEHNKALMEMLDMNTYYIDQLEQHQNNRK